MILPASEIACLLGQPHSVDATPISTLLTDSRDLICPAETVFFALRTPGNDGHNFVHELCDKGVKYFVVDHDVEAPDGVTLWKVADVVTALQSLARHARESLGSDVPVIGITGSRGKTVAKEMLNHLLRPYYKITRSPRSYNSQIGVPLSLWEIAPDTQLAIFEAGISQTGEMDSLEAIIKPSIGVFTSLTDEHSDGFASMEEKAHEKAKLFVNCRHVFYHDDPIIADALKATCPQATLHPVEGRTINLALAVARHLRPDVESTLPDVPRAGLLPRIDVTSSLKNCLIMYDGYTNDMRSLTDALCASRRHSSDTRSLTLVLGRPYDLSTPLLHRLIAANNATRLIAIGFDPGDVQCRTECVSDVAQFLERYTISDFKDELILVKGDAEKGFEDIQAQLQAPRHETVMEVDLGAVIHNFNYYRSLMPKRTGIVAMVKAAGYGVGSLELARTLQAQGAAYLAVAVVDEGAELRRAGITMPIMVMNPMSTNYKALFQNMLEPSVFSLRELQLLLDNAERLGISDYPVHIKLDTGMHRIGFIEDEIPHLLKALRRQGNVLRVKSIFSHLATADCLDQDAYTEHQLQAFRRMSDTIIEHLGYPVLRHVLNTAGMMRYPEHHYDMARLGIGLYGVSPVPEIKSQLAVVARLYSTIISIKHWDPGTTIGYGRRGVVTMPSVIATIPIGYADGLDRHLSNGAAYVIVNGVKCPIIGNICMDQCMIDVTDANASIGDKVEIFGDNAPIERLSDTLGTIPYEILTSISPRVKRIYVRG